MLNCLRNQLLYILFTNDLPEVVHNHVTCAEQGPVKHHQLSPREMVHEVGQEEHQAEIQAEEGGLQHP